MNPIHILFKQEKTTPGAVRYEEVDTNGAAVPSGKYKVGTLYIRKSALSEPYPADITVSITTL